MQTTACCLMLMNQAGTELCTTCWPTQAELRPPEGCRAALWHHRLVGYSPRLGKTWDAMVAVHLEEVFWEGYA